MWISPKTLCSPVLVSFADSKLFGFSRLAGMPLCINEHCVSCAIYGKFIIITILILSACMRSRIIVDAGHRRLLRSLAELSTDPG